MVSPYDELFSTMGYSAIDLVFGINSYKISEKEKRELIKLAKISESNKAIEQQILMIREQDISEPEKKNKLLSLLY
ncbi:hypothetical protein ACFQRG_09785 [Scopulibacillus cellulosilyticus]|uniref:Uncharacterized protein n=1 Tax=Scopulibacillus cellulosilyticus TaxID=2665665 RepID=A0ABW2PVV5_9BACL